MPAAKRINVTEYLNIDASDLEGPITSVIAFLQEIVLDRGEDVHIRIDAEVDCGYGCSGASPYVVVEAVSQRPETDEEFESRRAAEKATCAREKKRREAMRLQKEQNELDELARLQKKYGLSDDEALAERARLQEKLNDLK